MNESPSARLPAFKQSLEPEISKMDAAAKKAYLASFADHPGHPPMNPRVTYITPNPT